MRISSKFRPFGSANPILRGLRSGLGKSAIIYPVSTLQSLAIGSVNLGLVFYLRDRFAVTPATVGFVAALSLIAYFIGCFIFRPFSRMLLPRFSLLLSVSLNMIFAGGMLVSGSVVGIAICNTLFGFGLSLFWPPIMGWLSSGLEGKELGGALGRFNLSWSMGMIVSPYFTGVLTELDSRYSLVAGIIFLALISLVVLVGSFAIPEIRNDNHREPAPAKRGVQFDTSTDLRFPAWIGLASSYMLMGIFSVVFPIHARTNLGLTESAIGTVLLVRAVANTVAFVLLGRISRWHYKVVPIVAAPLLLAISCGVLAVADRVFAYFIVLPFIGVLMALSYTESAFHGVSGTSERARRMAIHEILLVSGSVTGSLGGSYVFQSVSIGAMFLIAAGILLIATVAQIVTILALRRRGARTTDIAVDASKE